MSKTNDSHPDRTTDPTLQGNRVDPVFYFFSQLSRLSDDLRFQVLTLRSHPTQLSLAAQLLVRYAESDAGDLVEMLRTITCTDQATADLQFAESYLLEANACRETGDIISACVLYEMGSRLCQRAEDNPVTSELLPTARQWRAECLAKMAVSFQAAGEPLRSRNLLRTAQQLFISLGNRVAAARCGELIESASGSSADSATRPYGSSTLCDDDVIPAAIDSLHAGRLVAFLQMTPRAISLIERLRVEDRVQAASRLLSYRVPEYRSGAIHRLAGLVEKHPNWGFLREGPFLWAYFTGFCCYGISSNSHLLYLLIRMVECLALGVTQVTARALFRELFRTHYEEAFRWALSSKSNLLALRIADYQKSRATLDLLMARRDGRAQAQIDFEEEVRLIIPDSLLSPSGSARGEDSKTNIGGGDRWATIGKFEFHLETTAVNVVSPREELVPFISVNAARRLLNADSLLLEYFVCEDLLHVFAAPSTRFRDEQGSIKHWVTKVGTGRRSRLESACAQMRAANTRKPIYAPSRPASAAMKDCMDVGRQLYDLLIGGMTDHWTGAEGGPNLEELIATHHHVVVVPAGPLASVPWLALLSPHGWLWQNRLLSVLPSLSFLFAAGYVPRPLARSMQHVLIVGNPTRDLPGTETECERITELLGRTGIQCTEFLREKATVASVCAAITKCDAVHFACHGKQIQGDPAESYVALSDGKLSCRQLSSLDLEGKAVVLSCCESALGETTWGDDCFALAHACLIAGARYVLASLWPVEDQSTALLMQTFYSNYLAGWSPQMSLNLAVHALARSECFSHPFHWAAFEIFGSPEDLDTQAIVRRTMQSMDTMPSDLVIMDDPMLDEKRLLKDGLRI